MRYEADTFEEYIAQLPEDRKEPMARLREEIAKNIPEGFSEGKSYGMPAFVVPFDVYPDGYHCKPEEPLPFISIASQKNFIAVYHMGVYADPDLMEWFTTEYAKRVPTKLDMGKSCIRFKKMDQIPYDLIGELAGKISCEDWVSVYESHIKK